MQNSSQKGHEEIQLTVGSGQQAEERAEGRRQRTEGRGQKTGDRSQETGDRSQSRGHGVWGYGGKGEKGIKGQQAASSIKPEVRD
jgi:hypothetical protein